MAKNVDRILRVVSAATALIEIEARYSAGKSAKGASPAKRELRQAFEDYMTHHAIGIK
jgi:hypothetical protein